MRRAKSAYLALGFSFVCMPGLTRGVSADPPYWYHSIVDRDPNMLVACGNSCCLAFDPNGDPGIVYVDHMNQLVLARGHRVDPNINGDPNFVWTKSVVPDPNQQGFCSLAWTPEGFPAVAYYSIVPNPNDPNTSTYTCKFAWEDGGGWHQVPVWLYCMLPSARIQLTFDLDGRPWLATTSDWYLFTYVQMV
jgi:hypothetical protein